jgi:hypothetical protein
MDDSLHNKRWRSELAQQINDESTTWTTLKTREESVLWVIAWCDRNDIPAPLIPKRLARAMGEMPYWNQGPSNYLDMVFAATALQARQGVGI